MCLKRGDMSTANAVFKINEVAKEFGFTIKEKQKNYKTVCLFFGESSLVALFSTSITMEYRQEYLLFLFLIITQFWVHCLGQSSRSSRFLEE